MSLTTYTISSDHSHSAHYVINRVYKDCQTLTICAYMLDKNVNDLWIRYLNLNRVYSNTLLAIIIVVLAWSSCTSRTFSPEVQLLVETSKMRAKLFWSLDV